MGRLSVDYMGDQREMQKQKTPTFILSAMCMISSQDGFSGTYVHNQHTIFISRREDQTSSKYQYSQHVSLYIEGSSGWFEVFLLFFLLLLLFLNHDRYFALYPWI